ncbi:MAG TPA: hypothetical protein VK206_10195 [Anaerolineales bacterium]|nr:hypothetical protein [Anaerolineales bacterium]
MMSDSYLKTFLFIVILILLTACGSPATQAIPTETPSRTPSPLPTSKPTNTIIPTATSIPGFEDWSVFNARAVDIKTENGSLILTLKYHALWFMEQRGVLIYKPVNGNFKITANVLTSKNSDPTQPPGGDGSAQLGGLMVRNGNGGQENYVFIVAGDDGSGLSVETKTTQNGLSKYEGPEWNSPDAELRLCRFEPTFNLYKRHVNTNEAWTLAKTFDRPDLPETLQVGVNIYTDSEPDLQIRYDNITVQPIVSESDCRTD